jgi:hypothetical protein
MTANDLKSSILDIMGPKNQQLSMDSIKSAVLAEKRKEGLNSSSRQFQPIQNEKSSFDKSELENTLFDGLNQTRPFNNYNSIHFHQKLQPKQAKDVLLRELSHDSRKPLWIVNTNQRK